MLFSVHYELQPLSPSKIEKTLLTHTSGALLEKAHEGVVRHKAAYRVHMMTDKVWYRRHQSHGLDRYRQDTD